ncbi:MAG: PAS domain S-box protein [Myxococcales bacterium]|nr:PAS domain S-box protein [Myxococcales bacterium]
MKAPPLPSNEPARLRRLHELEVLDTDAEAAFDGLTTLAAYVAQAPIALVSLVDADRQWFKSRYGLSVSETSRDVSFCGHVLALDAPLVVADAFADARFADNPLVTGDPRVRFYAGMPLRTADGFVLGTLCAIDHHARELGEEQRGLLEILARQVVDQLERRRQTLQLRQQQRALELEFDRATETARRLGSILASARVAIIETALDGTIREFNPAAEHMLGLRSDEVVGKATPGIFHDSDEVCARAAELSAELGRPIEPGFEAFVAKAREVGVDEREWTYVRKDGARFPVNLSVTLRTDAAGALLGYLGIASDISARVKAERALAQRTALLVLGAEVAQAFATAGSHDRMLEACVEVLVQNLEAAFVRIWTVADEGGLVLRASAGRSRAGAALPARCARVEQIARDRLPYLTNAVQDDPLFDRDWVVAEGLVSFVGCPLLQEGQLLGVLALFSTRALPANILEALTVVATNTAAHLKRVHAEARLRESEMRAKSIVDSAVDAVVTIDERGRIEHANPAVDRIFGHQPQDLVGQNVRVLMPSPDRERHDSYLSSYASTGRRTILGVGREVEALRRSGERFPAELSVSEFMLGGRRLFTGIIRDISERKRMERLQAEFVSTVSHELRTPLTSIRGALGLVAGGVTGALSVEAQEYVDIALANSQRLVRLINDILDIEKMQSGSLEFRLGAFALAPIIRAAIAAQQGFATEHGVTLAVPADLPAGEVLVDVDRLVQVLDNLVSNAVKFSPRDAAVELTVAVVDERFFHITVRDHGPGIPESFRERIFERFAQADASNTRQRGGTGLGLAISRTIVHRMRGQIGFDTAEGGGTVFWVDLPYLAPVERGLGARRVLVCEDDPDVARLLARLVESAGFVVDVAPTVERARRLVSTHRYAGITLDLNLADGPATPLVAELRASEVTRHTPIIVVSGSPEGLGNGAVLVTDVLEKPFDEARLLAALENAMAECKRPDASLLHVEDDEDIRRVVRRTLPATWDVVGAASVGAAKQALLQRRFEIIILDLSLPDGTGEDLLSLVGDARVILFSASHAPRVLSDRVAAALLKSVASPQDLRVTIESLLSRAGTLP